MIRNKLENQLLQNLVRKIPQEVFFYLFYATQNDETYWLWESCFWYKNSEKRKNGLKIIRVNFLKLYRKRLELN